MNITIPTVIAFISVLLPSILPAQNSRIELPSTFNPVGSGARALGMGGAFISIADDATAASWNPAALIQLRRPELAIVASTFYRGEDNTFATNPEASGLETVSNQNLNYFSASTPCRAEVCGKNMVFSLSYQHLFNFDKKWFIEFIDTTASGRNNSNNIYRQQGDLYALGLALAVQVTEDLSIGATLNLWNNWLSDNQWQQNYTFIEREYLEFDPKPYETTSFYNESYDFSGINMNLGLWWHIFQRQEKKLTLGIIVKTPFTADMTHTRANIEDDGFFIDENSDSYQEKLTMPLSYGLGLSYQFSDHFTLAADIYQTRWDKFILQDEKGNQFSPISDLPKEDSQIKQTTQIRLGGEYRYISQEYGSNYIIPLRAGIFYDPAPTEGGVDKYYGFTLGGGIAFTHYVFDIAYQYRFGSKVNQHVLADFNFSQDIDEHTVYTSLFYRF